MKACTICGRGRFRGNHDTCTRRTEQAAHIAWFERTGHCGQCGQPGNYCICGAAVRDLCGCHDLHPVGAGLAPDALTQFADAVTEQEGLF